MRKIRSGDDVIVIAGKDKGRRGQVLRIVDHERVLVEGVNLVKRHTRANPAAGAPGGIIEREAPIHISNVMLYNPRTERGGVSGSELWKMDARCGTSRPITK